jgi:sulfite reductase beta subunit-like hemoprotein
MQGFQVTTNVRSKNSKIKKKNSSLSLKVKKKLRTKEERNRFKWHIDNVNVVGTSQIFVLEEKKNIHVFHSSTIRLTMQSHILFFEIPELKLSKQCNQQF